MRAVEEGVSWCDSTILGMGRGAGNVSTESLVMECKKMNYHDADPSIVAACAKTFLPLKQKYNWGPNPYYHFAANHSIHPSYVQSLLSDKRYNSSTYFKSLKLYPKAPVLTTKKIFVVQFTVNMNNPLKAHGMLQAG